MDLLNKWLLTDGLPAYEDSESATAIEMVYKVYKAMQDMITDYNKFVDNTNKSLEEFQSTYNEDQETFTTSVRQEYQDYIDTIDLKIMDIESHYEGLDTSVTEFKNQTIQELTTFKNQVLQDLANYETAINSRLDSKIAEYDTRMSAFEDENAVTTERLVDGCVTPEKLSEDIQEKLGYLASKESDYTKVDKYYLNPNGDEISNDVWEIYYYELKENLDGRTLIITSKIKDSAKIVMLDNNKVLSYIDGVNMTTMTDYTITIPKGTNKIGISCFNTDSTNDIPKVALTSISKSYIESVVDDVINPYLASNESDYEVVVDKYLNPWGNEVSINVYDVCYYTLTSNLDERSISIFTRIKDGASICFYDSENNLLSAFNEGLSMNTMEQYDFKIPSGTTKIGISCYKSNQLQSKPIIRLEKLTSENVRYIVRDELENPSTEDETLTIEKNGGACRIFHDWGVIGDSLSSGCLERTLEDGGTGYPNIYPYSWGQCMARAMGVNVVNYSSGGQTAKSINESNFEPISPLWNSKQQVYVIGLGTNDYFKLDTEYTNGWGSASDIDLTNYNNNGDSFVGWYAKIIQRVRQVNPDCYLFLLTNPINHSDDQLNAITTIASKFNRCYVINTNPYRSNWNDNYKLGGHLSPYGYLIYGDYVMSLISKLILENESNFKNVGFIGTEYINNNFD